MQMFRMAWNAERIIYPGISVEAGIQSSYFVFQDSTRFRPPTPRQALFFREKAPSASLDEMNANAWGAAYLAGLRQRPPVDLNIRPVDRPGDDGVKPLHLLGWLLSPPFYQEYGCPMTNIRSDEGHSVLMRRVGPVSDPSTALFLSGLEWI